MSLTHYAPHPFGVYALRMTHQCRYLEGARGWWWRSRHQPLAPKSYIIVIPNEAQRNEELISRAKRVISKGIRVSLPPKKIVVIGGDPPAGGE